MPDENTQKPEEDKTFTIDQEALEANPNAPVENPAEGEAKTPATEEPIAQKPATEAPAAEEPATETPPAKTPVKPTSETPENLEQKLDEHLTEATKPAPETQDSTKSSKKYLIIIIVVIALLAGGYFIYTYFIAGPAETNTLSPSDAMEELDEIVDELENVYAPPAEDEIEVFEEAVLEEVDNSFPTLTEPVENEPVEELTLEEPIIYEPLLGEPPIDEPVMDEPEDLKVLR